MATIVLLDPATGELLALLDGRYITEARTAAVSALSTRLLAREDAATLAIVGSGVQARSHLEAIGRVRRLAEVRVWSRSAAHRAAFANDMQPRTQASIVAADSAEEAVNGAAIVVLATSAKEPVVQSDWIADGTHICAVGACRPDQREMEGALVGRSRVFVDSRAGALAEAGDIVLAIRDGAFAPGRIAGELGELAAGRVPGREHAAQITLFKSLGMAVEDVAAAHLAYVRATERGLGRGIVV
jgi:ornithine cyclodeaminase